MKKIIDEVVKEEIEIVPEPCGFCKCTAGPEHISVCTFCGGELHQVNSEVAECACCGKKFGLTAL